MLIDCHTHVLAMGLNEEFAVQFNRQALLCVYRAQGLLPSHRLPTEEEWRKCNLSFQQTDPNQLLKDYKEFDKVVVLAFSPHYFEDLGLGGTTDSTGVTGVARPPHPEKCNDYIAALVKQHPDKLIGFGSVNPNYKGPKAAVKELERAICDLKLTGLKLYPTYQHWSPDDRNLAFPIFEKAQELGIPVTVHMAGSTVTSAPMKYSKPMLLDDVGNEFRNLKLIIAHMGLPWVDEAKYLLTKHANFYGDLSYFNGCIDRENLYRFLLGCKPYFVPLEKLFFGSDYPAYDHKALVNMLKTVNCEAERLGTAKISQKEIEGILGDNFARFMGIIE